MRSEGHSDYFIEHRATCSVDEAPRVLGQVTRKGVFVRSALTPDGSLLIAMFERLGPGGPIGLYRARACDGGSFEVLQRYPGSTSKGANKPDRAPRTELAAFGGSSFLVPSPRGIWFVTRSGRDPAEHLADPRVRARGRAPRRRASALGPAAGGIRRRSPRCAIGELLAIGTNGASVAVTITDGLVARRVEGHHGGRAGARKVVPCCKPRRAATRSCSRAGWASCDATCSALATRASRDAPYEQQELPEPTPEPPPPPPIRRDAWLERARLVHLIRTISAMHHDARGNPHGFEGDAARGRTFAYDGSGALRGRRLEQQGAIAMSFDHDYLRVRAADLLEYLPQGLASLAEDLIGWKKPINDVAWFSVADDRGGGASNTDRLRAWKERDEEQVCADWKELHSISDAQLALARALARATASGRHTLTEAEANILLAHSGRAPTSRPSRRVEVAVRLFAAVGLDWAARPPPPGRSARRKPRRTAATR